MRRFGWLTVSLLLACTGCECGETPGDIDGGDDAGPGIDAGDVDGGSPGRCGNSVVEGSEQCDDGNREAGDGCSADCADECGDGYVGGGELCDPGIAAGDPGACPTDCDDGDDCTTDAIDGTGCAVECSNGPITLPADDDMCCPPGADRSTDNDCTTDCGNGTVEAGETCDTLIAAGDPGACPTACDDGDPCTVDAITMDGTCMAACGATPITMAMGGDGCCPSGATPATDSDCAGCGDGVVMGPAETCDTGIATGTGSCPTTCADTDPCTVDALANGGTCQARCTFTPLTAGPMDMCCPPGATMMSDPDCVARCGDRAVVAPETCDDGNMVSGDGCSATCTLETVGFRFTELFLRDPHVYADVGGFIGCQDGTNLMVLGINGVNPLIQENITMDGDMDGDLDLSILQAFNPLTQAAGSTAPSYLAFPTCTAPMSSTMCTLAAGAPRTAATVMNSGGATVCLDEVPGTARDTGGGRYMPAIIYPTAPAGGTCYMGTAGTITFDLGGIMITLQDARIGGEWFGNPATEIRDGLIRGFISEANADTTIIPDGTTGIASIDNQPLSSLLRGGTGACLDPSPAVGDKDTFTPPGGGAPITGWYFYLNFRAARVPYTEL